MLAGERHRIIIEQMDLQVCILIYLESILSFNGIV